MSRRVAIIVAIVAVLVFAVVYFWPERAVAGPDVGVSVSGRLHLGDGAVNFGTRFTDGDRWRDRDRHRWKHRRHGRWHRRHRPLVVLQAPSERVIERETVIVQPPPAPPPPAAAAPPEPLDPQGQARTLPARGGAAPREWVLGEVVPPGVPHVVLDPVAYGLPRPPLGQIYARVEGDVLRIETGTRRIVGVVAN